MSGLLKPFGFLFIFALITSTSSLFCQESDSLSRFEQGKIAYKQNDLAVAKVFLKSSITNCQKIQQSYYYLGLTEEKGGGYSQALVYLDSSITVDSTMYFVSTYVKGRVYYKMKNHKKAKKIFKAILKRYPGSVYEKSMEQYLEEIKKKERYNLKQWLPHVTLRLSGKYEENVTMQSLNEQNISSEYNPSGPSPDDWRGDGSAYLTWNKKHNKHRFSPGLYLAGNEYKANSEYSWNFINGFFNYDYLLLRNLRVSNLIGLNYMRYGGERFENSISNTLKLMYYPVNYIALEGQLGFHQLSHPESYSYLDGQMYSGKLGTRIYFFNYKSYLSLHYSRTLYAAQDLNTEVTLNCNSYYVGLISDTSAQYYTDSTFATIAETSVDDSELAFSTPVNKYFYYAYAYVQDQIDITFSSKLPWNLKLYVSGSVKKRLYAKSHQWYNQVYLFETKNDSLYTYSNNGFEPYQDLPLKQKRREDVYWSFLCQFHWEFVKNYSLGLNYVWRDNVSNLGTADILDGSYTNSYYGLEFIWNWN
ncbi:MAG: tetratricopeptide repeat protein [Fibrobacteria bacterium]|nr:tetratricopeptide repeat protein [Fibrobacteria bacterium]